MILLEPLGGLANRMRVIASGLSLMNQTNNELAVIWNLKEELNCNFDLIFEKIPDVSFVKKEDKYIYLHRNNQVKLFKRIKARIRNKLLGIDYCLTEGDLKETVFHKKIPLIANKYKRVYISTTQEFCVNYEEYKKFKPRIEIQDIINHQLLLFGKNTIGIHIRQTDNLVSIDKSPITLFIAKMDEELKKDKEVKFFLATDEPKVENELISLFGDKIIVYKKELNRNTQKGIIDAVVDLYCLSNTKYIYGSYYSSFSDIASVIGSIEKITLKLD